MHMPIFLSSRDNTILIYDAQLIVNSLPLSAWFSLGQNHTNFSWCSCKLLQNTSKLCISGFALVPCAQFMCVKSGVPPFGHGWILAGSLEGWSVSGWCGCGVEGSRFLWIQLQWAMLYRQLCVVCMCASPRHFPPFTRRRCKAVDAWLSVKRQWLCAVEKGNMLFKCLLVSLGSDKPQRPRLLWSLFAAKEVAFHASQSITVWGERPQSHITRLAGAPC